MTVFIHLAVLAILLLVMGYLTTQPGAVRERIRGIWPFVSALGIAFSMVVVGLIVVLVILLLYALADDALGLGSGVFLGAIIVIVTAGIVVFLLAQPILRALGITHERFAIVEYYIQWFLIYVTVYQVAVDELRALGSIFDDAVLDDGVDGFLDGLVDPGLLIVILLPVLISVWIAIAMMRLRIEGRTTTRLDEATLPPRRRVGTGG